MSEDGNERQKADDDWYFSRGYIGTLFLVVSAESTIIKNIIIITNANK